MSNDRDKIGPMFVGGNTGESLVSMVLDQTPYKVYRNIYVKDSTGDICQIDFLLVSDNNIIVLEVKNYNNCVIKGDNTGNHWTACYRNKKHTFYNPIKQNMKHIGILSNCLSEFNIKFFSYIVFTDGCILDYTGSKKNSIKVLKASNLIDVLIDDCQSGKRISKQDMIGIKSVLDYFDERTYELSLEHNKYFMSRLEKVGGSVVSSS